MTAFEYRLAQGLVLIAVGVILWFGYVLVRIGVV